MKIAFYVLWVLGIRLTDKLFTILCRVRFVAFGSGSELILFDLRLLKPEEASSVKSNRGLLVLEALLPLPNFEWKTEEVT